MSGRGGRAVRRVGRARRVGWVGLLAALAFGATGCGLSLQSLPKPGGVSGPSYQLHAVFANVLNLPVQARVLVGANEVGQVSSISTANYRADLVLTIRRGVRLPVGTTAQILFDSPLGDEFIELHPPTGTAAAGGALLGPGSTLAQRDTNSAPSIADTLAALGALLNGGGLNQLQTIIVQLNDALNGHQPQVRAIINDITATVASLDTNLPNVDRALSGLAQLTAELARGSAAIATGIDTIGPAVAVLANENADFSQLLTSTDRLATVASSIVNASGQAGVATVVQLNAVVNQLVGVEQQLAPTLSDFSRFEKLTAKIAPGDYLQLSLNGTAIVNSKPLLGANVAAGVSGNQLAPALGGPVGGGGGGGGGSSNAQAIDGLLGAGLP